MGLILYIAYVDLDRISFRVITLYILILMHDKSMNMKVYDIMKCAYV